MTPCKIVPLLRLTIFGALPFSRAKPKTWRRRPLLTACLSFSQKTDCLNLNAHAREDVRHKWILILPGSKESPDPSWTSDDWHRNMALNFKVIGPVLVKLVNGKDRKVDPPPSKFWMEGASKSWSFNTAINGLDMLRDSSREEEFVSRFEPLIFLICSPD